MAPNRSTWPWWRWALVVILPLVIVLILASRTVVHPGIRSAFQRALHPPSAIASSGLSSTPAIGVATDSASPTSTSPTATAGPRDVAGNATITVSGGNDSKENVVGDNPDAMWSAGGPPPQWIQFTLNQPYLVSQIRLVVSQLPAGQTTQEIYLGDASGPLVLYRTLNNTWTYDKQSLDIPIDPPRVISRVMIKTTSGPSWVAWRKIQIVGEPPRAGAPGVVAASGSSVASTGAASNAATWPRLTTTGFFAHPVQVTSARDGSGRIFVADLPGRIWVIDKGSLIARPFLDISSQVKCCEGEQGFFSVAFPPDFAQKQYFYVCYTHVPVPGKFGDVGDVVVERYHVTANRNVADPKSAELILTIPKQNSAHNGGHLEFGPKDGYLYVGIGDGGLQNDPTNEAQRLDSLKGKILRIDTESGVKPYAIPPTNPFVHTAGARPEIWVLGLRNPWQFAFDQKTGDLYIADVGENKYESVAFEPGTSHGGENYGWRVLEGMHCYDLNPNCDPSGFTLPVVEYTHDDGNCAIAGGQVYRGAKYPDMQGIFFYADYCSGKIWGLQRVNGQWVGNQLYQVPYHVTSIGSDDAGNLYLCDYSDGAIYELGEP